MSSATISPPKTPFKASPGFTIGGFAIPTRVLMAPMMGYNEPSLRRLVQRLGSGLLVTEMIKPEKLDTPNRTLRAQLALNADEHPIAAQISGRHPEPALRAASQLRAMGYDMIDLNFGCPLRKTCAKGRGAAMMREPELIGRLVRALVKELDCPVTVKLRTGWSDDEPTAPEAARYAVDNGAAAVCVHGRSKLGWYSTENDHELIRKTREAVPEVPFIANGDVVDSESARRIIANTGADAVMIGRAAVGNPWIFQQIQHALVTGEELEKPNPREIREVYDDHAAGLFRCLRQKTAFRYARKYAFFYFARYIDPDLRRDLSRAKTFEALSDILDTLADKEPIADSIAAARRLQE